MIKGAASKLGTRPVGVVESIGGVYGLNLPVPLRFVSVYLVEKGIRTAGRRSRR